MNIKEIIKINQNISKLGTGIWSIGKGKNKIVISSCVHGNELVGLDAIRILGEKIDKNKLINTEILFLVCNLEAIKINKRFVDCDMNRSFSDENIHKILSNNQLECYEYRRIREFLPYLTETNYLFDIHSTTLPSTPFIYCCDSTIHIETASLFHVDYIVSPTKDILHYKDFFCGLDNYIDNNNGIGLTIEAGSNEKSNANIVVDGIMRFLINKNLYDDEIQNQTTKPIEIKLYKALFANNDNCKIIKNNVENFSKYKNGEIITQDGDLQIIAKEDNMIIFPKLEIKKGECYGFLGYYPKEDFQLWSKKNEIDERVKSYVFSKNLASDRKLLPYDIQSSIAHAEMLCKIGIITIEELISLKDELHKILDLHHKDRFNLDGFEDVHSAIEHHLTKALGDVGKKIHTARSRNDQVLTALRLLTKEYLINVKKEIKLLANIINNFAKKYEFIPMPGFTHMQYAMPSSIGQWSGSFVESLLNDLQIIDNAIKINNQNPLGSAAGFGTSIDIDREFTAKKLNFAKVQSNSLFCQNSRGKFEVYTISCLYQVMMTLSKIANDIIIFSSQEFDYLKLSNTISTGSSIMPQKRNPDPLEVVRGKCSKLFGYIVQTGNMSHNLISGYNKDLKFTKDITIESLEITLDSLEVMGIVFDNIFVNKDILYEKFNKNKEIFLTDIANDLVIKEKIPFRDAYLKIKELCYDKEKLDLYDIDIDNNIRTKKHTGATGNLNLDCIIDEINNT